MLIYVFCFLVLAVNTALSAQLAKLVSALRSLALPPYAVLMSPNKDETGPWLEATLESSEYKGGPRQNLLRLAREDSKPSLSGTDAVRHLLSARTLNHLGGGQLLRALDPLSGGRLSSQLSRDLFLAFLDGLPGGDALRALDALADGELTASLEGVDAAAVLRAIRLKPKRTLDTLAGMAFGQSKKRFDSLSGATFGLSKRDFDEIDNVGFTGFAKRGGGRSSSLALAKKNFDEIDRAGFDTYNKRNFDEIDRAGFETFEKRDGKK